MRFFRVHLPRQFLHEASVISLIYAAEQEKVPPKKEQKLRQEWSRAQDAQETPTQRLERENHRLNNRIIRLDFENDQLASDIVHKENNMNKQLEKQADEAKRVSL